MRLLKTPAAITAATLLFAAAGGALAWAVSLPLAWMIGPLVVTAAVAMIGLRPMVPGRLRNAMTMVLGVMLGSAFTPDILDHASRWAASLAGLAVCLTAGATAAALLVRRFTRLDAPTAYFTAMPGGLNEMIAAGADSGGDDRTISLVHSARIMLVVLSIPLWSGLLPADPGGGGAAFGPPVPAGSMVMTASPLEALLLVLALAGAPVARLARLPASELTGPMLVSAALHLSGAVDGQPPGLLVTLAQVVVGASIGCRLAGLNLRLFLRACGIAVLVTAVMATTGILTAFALNAATGLPLPALILAYAPAGFAEMTLVALTLGVDTAFVATHHIFRIGFVVAVAPLVYGLLARRRTARDMMPGD
jgi:membrane AbrB-like protein